MRLIFYIVEFILQQLLIFWQYLPMLQSDHEILPIDYHPCDLSWG